MEEKFKLTEEPVEGTAVKVGNVTLIVPPLSLGWIKANKSRLKALLDLKGKSPVEQMDAMPDFVEMLAAAVRRNYPTAKEEDLLDIVDMRNFNVLIEAAMGQTEVSLPVGGEKGEVKPSASPM